MSDKCCDISCPFASTCVHFDKSNKAKKASMGRRMGLICKDYISTEDSK